MEQINETELNPPLECDSYIGGGPVYSLDADFIDDDDCEKAFGYTIWDSGRQFHLFFPESSEREGANYGPYDTLEEAHERLVEAAIEDGALLPIGGEVCGA
jgi:hypothetical protein